MTTFRENYDQPNYDESLIAPYTLEDPLSFADGRKLQSPEEWPARRREILDIFAKEMYGQEPPKPEAVVTELVEERRDALAGFAIRSQYRMWFKKDKTGPSINWIVIRPRYAKKPVPVILFLNFNGNFELTPDVEVPMLTEWCRNSAGDAVNHRMLPSVRGRFSDPNHSTVLPIGTILARGYAVMSACYCEVSPDPDADWIESEPRYRQDNLAYYGVFSLWGKRDESRDDNTTALGAWAWALSRGLDLAERIPEIDAKRSVVTGCSRLGKTALLAAARDERFAVCVPVQSGAGGVPLAKRDFGENIGTETKAFKHWFCKAYKKYAMNPPELLHFDQHLLVASIAPRPLLVEGFVSSQWFDTKGEYLSCRAASPAWEFLGKSGLPNHEYPEPYDTCCIGENLGYVSRTEEHGISAYDWMWTLDFADKAFKNS